MRPPSTALPLALAAAGGSIPIVVGGASKVPLPYGSICPSPSTQFLDSSGLVCAECDPRRGLIPDRSRTDPHGNAAGCVCSPGLVPTPGGGGTARPCSEDCADSGMGASSDGLRCVSCGGGGGDDDGDGDGSDGGTAPPPEGAGWGGSAYVRSEGGCSCGNPPPGSSDPGYPVSTRRLAEVPDPSTGLPSRLDCVECPLGTAVISEGPYGGGDGGDGDGDGGGMPEYHTTAGRRYAPDPYTCAPCPDPNMYFNSAYECVCPGGFITVGDASFGETSCVRGDEMPTVEADSLRVRFEGGGVGDVDSVALSHYYTGAASACEFSGGDEAGRASRGGAACQTLGNLCVMTMYDEESAPCRQFRGIVSEGRGQDYRSQEGWKLGMPWLYYQDEADDVAEDRGVLMRMALSDGVPGRTHRLRYKLAKYSLDGDFLGIEDLGGQFHYCPSSSDAVDYVGADFANFGTDRRCEYRCDLNDLLGEEMFFYDMYVVDDGDDTCDDDGDYDGGNDCLYPVPVLHRNFVHGKSFPNMNGSSEDEHDDRYTRRFFLFDNMSERSASGLEVLRYAKKIVLRTTIREDDTSRIYPPKLIIEYAHAAISEDKVKGHDGRALASLVFKSEYTMKTDRLWTTVRIVTGFVSAVGFVVWVLRSNNWQNRNRSTSSGGKEEYLLGAAFLVHVLVILFHTSVLVFFPFVFAICAYWFIFFKLQHAVFLLMPPDSEFYHVSEYLFFTIIFHGMFLLHSVYILYIIFRQCNVDVFLVDWEKPKGRNDGVSVSLWRTVLIANEWNRMQARRKISVEFNLIGSCFLLLGLGLKDNPTSQPGFGESSGGTTNIALRFANTVFVWAFCSTVQWLWRFLFYERYCTEPHSQRFIDLCTVAKISVFLLDEAQHGYYLHCRSPYAFADCGMQELAHQLNKEARGFTADRGLDAPGCPPDAQSFELFASSAFRRQINKVFKSLTAQPNGPGLEKETGRFAARGSTRGGGGGGGGGARRPSLTERSLFAKLELNVFLRSFVDQSPPPRRDGLRRVVRERPPAERILGTPPADVRARDGRCVLHIDRPTWIRDHGFLGVTFLGIEFDLLLHDVLAFNSADLIFDDPAVSVLFVYVLHLLRGFVRSRFGRANIVRKAFVDDRFLF